MTDSVRNNKKYPTGSKIDPSSHWCSNSFSDWARLSHKNGTDIQIIGDSPAQVSEQIQGSGRLEEPCA